MKICETRTLEDAKVAVEAGANFIGLILFEDREMVISLD